MRRGADERDARRGMAQTRDQFRYFEAGQLPTLARLGTLRDLDFDFSAGVQIFRRHAEPPRCNLFDRRGRIIAIRTRFRPGRIFPALAAIGPRPDPVHRDGKRFMRFRR